MHNVTSHDEEGNLDARLMMARYAVARCQPRRADGLYQPAANEVQYLLLKRQ